MLTRKNLRSRRFATRHRFCAAGFLLLAVALAVFPRHAFADVGAATYKAHCSACHGAKGAADTMLGRNLGMRHLGSEEVQKESDEELFNIISKGRKKRMPAYDNKLSREQINELVKHIRSLKP